jgi:sec-independent protein translocase protein TatA
VPFGVGFPELIILLIVLLLVFGAKRLPEMGRSLGKGMREFKEGVSGVETSVMDSEPAAPAQLPPSAPPETTTSAAQIQRDVASLSDEEREEVLQSLGGSSDKQSPETEREPVS